MIKLQWSRRVNTAEWNASHDSPSTPRLTSMEPPCEHGGVTGFGEIRAQQLLDDFNGAAV